MHMLHQAFLGNKQKYLNISKVLLLMQKTKKLDIFSGAVPRIIGGQDATPGLTFE